MIRLQLATLICFALLAMLGLLLAFLPASPRAQSSIPTSILGSLEAPAPRIVAQVLNGEPLVSISALFVADAEMRLERLNNKGEVMAEWPVKHGTSIVDKSAPLELGFSYRLIAGTEQIGNSIVIAPQGPIGKVELISASSKRALFRLRINERSVMAVIPIGAQVSAMARQLDDRIMHFESRAILESIELGEQSERSYREFSMASPSGEPLAGIDDDILSFWAEGRRKLGPSRMVATLRIGEDVLQVQEGEGVALPLHFRAK